MRTFFKKIILFVLLAVLVDLPLLSLLYSNSFINKTFAQISSYGTVKSFQKISDTQGGFTGTLVDDDQFGFSTASLGDLDNDGVNDVAVGSSGDDDGGSNRGAVWILFLNSNGTVKSFQKISDTQGGFDGTLSDGDAFGISVASIGDLDNDNIVDLAVGAMYDGDGGTARGAVWILFMNSNGTVKDYQKISDTQGSFTGTLEDSDYFGSAVAGLGDLNGDNTEDIAVGAEGDDDGGFGRGAVWILFMNADGTVDSYQNISDTQGSFSGELENGDTFGESVASLGNLNGSGGSDIAVGASGDDDGGSNHGAVWILFLNSNGTVSSFQKISDTEGNFTGTLNSYDYFGCSVAKIDDLDGDSVSDLVVGAEGIYNGTQQLGAVWILFMNSGGTVKSFQKIDTSEGGFTGTFDNDDYFGSAVASIGDIDNDKVGDILVGAREDDDGGAEHGAAWVLNLNGYYVSNILNLTSSLSAVLTTDWMTNVETEGQSGIVEIGIIESSSNLRIASLDVDFTEDRDWTELSAGSTTDRAFFHYPGGFSSIPGASGEGYTLYVPKGDGDTVGICPGISSLDELNDDCSGIYFLSESDDNVTVTTEGGIEYWKISGLTSSGGFTSSSLANSGQKTNQIFGLFIILLDLVIYYSLFKKESFNIKFEKRNNIFA